MKKENLPVAIIGGGPIGLAAAAHLADRNIPFVLFEAGESVGQNFLSWGHVRVFSPWEYNLDKAAVKLLSQTDWISPDPAVYPTGKEIVEQYFFPLAQHPAIKPYLHLNTKVRSVGRKGLDKMKTAGREDKPFSIVVDKNGSIELIEARAILDASGTWNQPNPIGSGGIFAEGEKELSSHIFYGIPDVKGKEANRYKNKNIAVVGSGHSAINALLDLADVKEKYPETQLNWILRKNDLAEAYGGKEDDAFAARGDLGIRIEKLVESGNLNVYTPFYIHQLTKDVKGIQIQGELNGEIQTIPDIDEIISNTGSRPEVDMIREIRINIDSSLESVSDLAELIDPNIHSCGTVRAHGEKELRHPEKDFYIVGSKSYGRAPTFLMATGYEQVRSVVAYLDGDIEAAEKVELNLPETGVCSSNLVTEVAKEACCEPGCCEPSKQLQIEPVVQTVSCSTPAEVLISKQQIGGCC